MSSNGLPASISTMPVPISAANTTNTKMAAINFIGRNGSKLWAGRKTGIGRVTASRIERFYYKPPGEEFFGSDLISLKLWPTTRPIRLPMMAPATNSESQWMLTEMPSPT